MKPRTSFPQFRQIEERLRSIGTLADYDPIFDVVREQFLREINHHLTSLTSSNGNVPDASGSEGCDADCRERLKATYLEIGKEHAVMQLLFDMTREDLRMDGVRVLAEILFGSAQLRDTAIAIRNSSGKRKQATSPDAIERELERLLKEFNDGLKRNKAHPILLATELHHGFTLIHPFKDWNGRIARLILNVSLMKAGYLPVLIRRAERRSYFEALEAADYGDLEPLILFLAEKELESIEAFTSSAEFLSIKGKFELERRLKGLGQHDRCLVLTEDSTSNSLLAVLLEASGFHMNETYMLSYEGCSKIASANLFSIFVKQRMPDMHVLVHRDRDYLTDAEIEYQHETFHRIDVRFFYTEGTDVESYFLNADHLCHCYPKLEHSLATALVEDAINEVLPKSIDYLYKKEFGNRRESTTHLYGALVDYVKSHRFRFTHGKTAKQVLEQKIREAIGRKAEIERVSPALRVPQLAKIARRIWNEQA